MARTAGRQASTAGGGQLDSIRRIRYENRESTRSSSTPVSSGAASPARIARASSGDSVSAATVRSASGTVSAGRAARIFRAAPSAASSAREERTLAAPLRSEYDLRRLAPVEELVGAWRIVERHPMADQLGWMHLA